MTWEEFEKGMQEMRDQFSADERRWEARWEEFQKGLQQVGDQQLATARLLEMHGRDSNARLQRIETILLSHEGRLGDAEERQRGLEAAMRALIETVDRFLRGREGNGQKGQQ